MLALPRFSILLLALAAAPAAAARPADAYDDAVSAFKDALFAKDTAKRTPAFEKLVALNDPRTLPALHGFLIELIPQLKDKEKKFEVIDSDRERKAAQIERRKKNAKDDGDKASVATSENDFQKWLEREYEPLKKDTEAARDRRQFLTKSVSEVIATLTAEKRLAESKRLEKLVTDAKATAVQRESAMECYARFGDKDAVTVMLRVARDAQKERKRLQAEAPDKEAAFEKVKEVFHRERKQMGGDKTTVATAEQMKKAQGEMDNFEKALYEMMDLEAASFGLMPTALASLAPELKSKAVTELLTMAKGGDVGLRVASIQVLGGVNDPSVLAFLRAAIVASGSDAGTRVGCIDALAQLKDEGALDAILDKCIKDPEWSVRSAAIAATRRIRSAKSIPALLAAFDGEGGRLRDDAGYALRDLSGKDFGTPAAWKAWWEKAQGEGFTPVPEAEASKAKAPAEDGGTRVTFAGIPTSSKNVIFLVDVSGSMKFSLEEEKDAGSGQTSRLQVLKKELKAALERFPEGGMFSIITFSSFVTRWTPKLEKMTPDARKKALDFAAKLEAEGSTNAYGALKDAFDMAGRGTYDKYYHPAVDVIYFLTDGRPSPDSEVSDTGKILAAVREWNKLGKIAIHVICLGEADPQFLRKLAAQNHGEFSQP